MRERLQHDRAQGRECWGRCQWDKEVTLVRNVNAESGQEKHQKNMGEERLESFEGSLSNIIGLPMERIMTILGEIKIWQVRN